ncbi:hypothetical protein B1R94_28190 [Mycolicibacterium litorale]|nr:hypothetical protein B1R94_28190 [Mycolicibacterium litorale]
MSDPNNVPGGGTKTSNGDRRLIIQIGLTALVVVASVMLVLYLLTSGHRTLVGHPVADHGASESVQAIRVASSNLVTKDGGSEPKVVVSLYEDFLCPHCAHFERAFGSTIAKLISAGTIAADYYMVAILDMPQNQNYSSRAGGAAYCVAQDSVDAFVRFHSALYANQPDELSSNFPTDADLAETARQAGAAGSVADCIDSERYVTMVQGLAEATGIHATPTVRINGEDYDISTPDALAEKVTQLAGR